MNYENLNDYELVYRIRECDDDAVRVMYEKYEPVIRGIAAKYFPYVKQCGADMNDLLQEGRIAVNKALASYDEEGKSMFYTYVGICLDRHFITYCRNLGTAKNYPLNYSVNDDCLYVIGDVSSDPSIYLMEKYEAERFISAKNMFDFRDSNIFELRCNGFSYKEIGQLLDLPIKTVGSRLSKMRETLQLMRNKF